MPEVSSHLPGTFCWWECASTDQDSGKRFYGQLFGWEVFDSPLGPDSYYTMFRVGGRDVAALYSMMPEMRAQGVPPNWMPYVSVASAAGTATRAAQLGGTVLSGPFDVMDLGRMAVIRDPAGATISIWEPLKHLGSGRVNEVGTNCWNELTAADNAKGGPFYTELFGWGTQNMPMGPIDYTLFTHPGVAAPVAGMMPVTPEFAGIPPHWMTYFSVADCDATADKAAHLGGKVHHGPFDTSVGRMAVLADPQGAVFSVITLVQP